MAVTLADLLPESARFPASNAARLAEVSRTSGRLLALAFDPTTDQTAVWRLIIPQGVSSTLTLVVSYIMASATTGSVRFQAAVEAITPGDATDLDAGESFDTDNSAGATVPGTAGYEAALSITLTNADSYAAGDRVTIRLRRDADGTSGTDDAAGDCYVTGCELRAA
jgi:hypothetical protein